MIEFNVVVDDVRKLHKRFAEIREKGIPYATRSALDGLAYAAKEQWPKEMAKAFTLRNRWTTGSIRVRRARGTNIATMRSEVYSVAPYMAMQERGGTEHAKGKHGVPIPTSSAAGMGLKSRPRTKLVRKRNYLAAISVAHGFKGGRQARNAQAIREARKTNGVAFLDLGRRKGLFRFSGKRGKPRMLYDLSRRTTEHRPKPTLEPTIAWVRTVAPRIMRAALMQQLDLRRRHFGTLIGPVRPVRY